MTTNNNTQSTVSIDSHALQRAHVGFESQVQFIVCSLKADDVRLAQKIHSDMRSHFLFFFHDAFSRSLRCFRLDTTLYMSLIHI